MLSKFIEEYSSFLYTISRVEVAKDERDLNQTMLVKRAQDSSHSCLKTNNHSSRGRVRSPEATHLTLLWRWEYRTKVSFVLLSGPLRKCCIGLVPYIGWI